MIDVKGGMKIVNTIRLNNSKKSFIFLIVFFFMFLAVKSVVLAQTAELNPGYISGTVRIGNEVINSMEIFAYDAQFLPNTKSILAETEVIAQPNSTSVNYNLVVNVPLDIPKEFGVTACGVYMDDNNDKVCFPIEIVEVAANQVTTQNFTIDNPGFIQGVGTITGDQVLQETLLSATSTSGPIFESVTVTDQSLGMAYKVPVVAGIAIEIKCLAFIDAPNFQFFKFFGPEYSVDVVAGETITVDCNFEPPSVGTVSGVIDNPGPLALDPYAILTLNDRTNLVNHVITSNPDGTYIFDELPAAEYDFAAYLKYYGNRKSLRTPRFSYDPVSPEQVTSNFDSPTYNIPAGQVTTVDFFAQQSKMIGKINFSGSAPVELVSRLTISSSGFLDTATSYGFGIDFDGNKSTGEYELILSEGPWSPPTVGFSFFNGSTDPAEYLNQRASFTDQRYFPENAIEVAPNAPVVRDLNIDLGEVAVEFSIVGETGQTLSEPQIQATCHRNDLSNPDSDYQSFFAYNLSEQDVEVGTVRFYAIESTCRLITRAKVGGSLIRFGDFEVDVKAGTTQVVSIGSPNLTIEFPEPDFLTSENSITVSGRATDDGQVTSVTVNGQEATLVSTGNPDDLNEVSFSATVQLINGPNVIETIAFDDSTPAKTSSDTRTVFKENALPTLVWTPADGETIRSGGDTTTVELEGTAVDDSAIATILVQGVPVPFQSTGNLEKPNEVSFALSMVLVDGDNFVEVIAKDDSNEETAQVHKIIVTPNQIPIADAGSDQTSEQQNAEGAQVILNGLGSSDADEDPLTYTWSGPFGEATGATPTVTIPAGTHQVTLIVNDGFADSLPDTVTIVVQDTTAPTLTVPANVTAEATGPRTIVNIGSATSVDSVNGTLIPINNAPADFPLGTTVVTWTVSDLSGNVATGTQTVTVVDTTPPVLTVPADVTIDSTGERTVVDIGTASAIDSVNGTVTPTNDAPADYLVGTTIVTWTAKDLSGNTATKTQKVTVLDAIAPLLTVPEDVVAEATGVRTTVEIGSATAVDAEDGTLTPTNDAPSDYPLGTTVVTWTVSDLAGNTATGTQNVTVQDTTEPVLTVPANVTVPATGERTVVNIGSASAVDAVNGTLTPTNNAPADYPVGTTVVIWTAIDLSGNTATGTQRVTVLEEEPEDDNPPVIQLNQLTNTLWAPNHKMVLVATVSASDLVDPNPSLNVTVSSNQSINGLGDGNTNGDWNVVKSGDTYQVYVLSERSGNSGPRVYTIKVNAADAAGNTSSSSGQVTVPMDQSKKSKKGKGKK